MALRHMPRALALFLLPLAAAATAQAPAPQPAPGGQPDGEIVVTGSLPLVVDIEEVARRCAACRRALARLQATATPPPGRRSRGPQELDEPGRTPDLGSDRPVDTRTANARRMMDYTETQTRASITSRRALSRPQADVRALADNYLRNLLSYVGPIVDREIQERRAPAAYASEDPAIRGAAVTDITDAVVQRLDRDHADVDLLAGPRPG